MLISILLIASLLVFTVIFFAHLIAKTTEKCPIPILRNIKFHKYPTWVGIRINGKDLKKYQVVANDGLARSQRVIGKALTSIDARNIVHKILFEIIENAKVNGKTVRIDEEHAFIKKHCLESLFKIYIIDEV